MKRFLNLTLTLFLILVFGSINAQSWITWDVSSGTPTATAAASSNPITGVVNVGVTRGTTYNAPNIFSANSGLRQPTGGLVDNFNGASIATQVLKIESSAYNNDLNSVTFSFANAVMIDELVITDADKSSSSLFWDDDFSLSMDSGATFGSVTYGVSNGGNITGGYAGATITTSSYSSGTYRGSDARGTEWISWKKSSAPTKTLTINYTSPNDASTNRAAVIYVAIKVSCVVPPTPVVSVTPATYYNNGSATISNYDSSYSYIFSPSGPTVGAGGVISNLSYETTYTVVASKGVCSSSTSQSFTVPGVDTDGDGVADVIDLDTDNDGILDSLEKTFCNLPNNPTSSASGAGAYKGQLIFFDWSGATLNSSTGTISRSTTLNGVTYTATISGFTGNASFNGSDIATWPGAGIKELYNLGGGTFKEGFYSPMNTSLPNRKASFNVTFTSSDPSIKFQIIPLDMEATSLGKETITFKTNGTPFSFLESNNLSYVIEGEGTNTLVYRNTNMQSDTTPNGNALFTTEATMLNVTLEWMDGGMGGQGVAFAIRPYCDIDGDGLPNYLDLDSDGDGCPDAVEGSDNVNMTHLAVADITTPFFARKWSIIANAKGNVSTTGANIVSKVSSAMGVPEIVNASTNNTSGTQGIAHIDTFSIGQGLNNNAPYSSAINDRCFCTLKNATSVLSPLDTKVGITALGRSGNIDSDNWPMSRKGGHIALEANTKGFTITRMSTTEIQAIANPVIGMMVYDTTENCLKSYVETQSTPSVIRAWKCMNKQGCPQGEAFNR
ncbi:thrombospondin type 3 repeat-containing protein [Riemerella anatipestifer]|nr:thrombospondin type 3 repeat-containing protein [Riemerella anatipestifer]MDY3325163.1 thrombospondin type 3 repeat-containing protein [Riemerella anatipestifer]MDY3352848.1 thrombospondin type 3 repeat-containing protein [Riemerella anatipestifer]